MERKEKNLIDKVNGKRVLFITTKNIDYIRNSQEVKILEENAKDVKLVYSSKKKYVGRIIEIWIRLLLMRMRETDIIFIGFAPQLILPVFKWKMRNKVIIIDFFISIYDTLIHDRRKFKDKGIIANICYYVDYITLKWAEHVIIDTKADERYFVEEFRSDESKFETLYLEADKTIYYPRETNKKEELKNKFVVLYFGSILPLQGVEVILDAVKILKDEKDILFQIIGPVPEKYSKPVQDNVEYIDWLSQETLAEYIANADLCLAGHFNETIDKAKRTIPGKAYIYAAMGKEMVLGDNEANRELTFEKSCYVKMGSSDELAKLISGKRKQKEQISY